VARRRCRVRAAFRAAARRAAGDRRRADAVACRDNAFRDAALRPSCFSAARTARDRRADGFLRGWLAARVADLALCFVRAVALAGGRGSFTPERRAFERPMAMACFVDRAPCLPSRM
jgi:hypothetical protein